MQSILYNIPKIKCYMQQTLKNYRHQEPIITHMYKIFKLWYLVLFLYSMYTRETLVAFKPRHPYLLEVSL